MTEGNGTQQPPQGLQPEGIKLWQAVTVDYELDQHELALLLSVCRPERPRKASSSVPSGVVRPAGPTASVGSPDEAQAAGRGTGAAGGPARPLAEPAADRGLPRRSAAGRLGA